MYTITPKTLYIVGTPIGNLGDVSERAAQTLAGVDFIAAEDTRVTRKLLSRLDIRTPMVSYREHNRRRSGAEIIERLQNGESAALVSDAGMPTVSDPGDELIEGCHAAGVNVTVVPGPCAAIAALCLSGLPAGRFCFEGFLSTTGRVRREHLGQLKDERRAMIFYEAPHKLNATLNDLHGVLGDRRVIIAREMTKIHEQVLRLTLSEAVAHFAQTPPRGEFVLIVQGAEEPCGEEPLQKQDAAVELARSYMAGGMSKSAAARLAAEEAGTGKNAVYRRLTAED